MSHSPGLRLSLAFCLLVALLPPVPAAAAAPPPLAAQPLAETGVKGLVWHDTDADGARGGGEAGLPYVKLCLYEESSDPPNGYDPDDKTAACAYSDGAAGSEGTYAITGVVPATYFLAVATATVLSIYELTTKETVFGPLEIREGELLTDFNVGYRTHLAADVDEDCAVNVVDIEIVSTAFGSTSSPYDLNRDGVVDALDLELAARYWGAHV